MGISAAMADKLLGAALGQSVTFTTTPYVALCTSTPTDSAPGTEASYTGYARESCGSAGASFGSPSAGSVSNTSAITFAACTGGTSTITYFQLYDAATGGNASFFGSCSLAVSSGITPSFGVGELTLTLT